MKPIYKYVTASFCIYISVDLNPRKQEFNTALLTMCQQHMPRRAWVLNNTLPLELISKSVYTCASC